MKNGGSCHVPVTSWAVHRVLRQERKRIMRLSTMRREGQKECLTYKGGCIKVVDGKTVTCPLKGDLRMCYGMNTTEEEIARAYRKMFRKEKK